MMSISVASQTSSLSPCSSLSDNCYELQSQLFGILQGAAKP
uniref:Uncharacterized protein n=1 Tax=Anguilla anguilla TaxID=7936 RepID=A0A0E9ULA9_ANGAN